MNLEYIVKTNKDTYSGKLEFTNICHLSLDLSKQTIESVHAQINLSIQDNEKIFMNGYQTWTTCEEYSKEDKIRGVHGIPKFLLNMYSFDRYGDYHFVDYPNTKGITHGFTWCYFRNKDKYRFFGSLNEHTGYTMFQYDANTSILTIEKDCKGFYVENTYDVLDFIYLEGSEQEVFDTWFNKLNIKPRTTEKLYGYSSWYNRYQNITEETCLEDLEHCSTLFEQGDLFQIDDGWEPFVGDWLESDKEKFPHGMKYVADKIHENGFKAGLWLAPFVAEDKSTTFKEHPDWFLKVDDKPWKNGCNWSGFYSLDLENKEVIDYITKVFDQVINEWGFDLVKLDFLYGGAPFGNEHTTRASLMFQGVDLLRTLCKDKLILGCGVPTCMGFGVFDYSRISCDVSLDLDDKWYMRHFHRERTSTKEAIKNIVSRSQLNNRAYGSDPDVFFLRKDNIKLDEKTKDDLAFLDAICGNVFLISDDPGKYDQTMIDKYKFYRELSTKAKLIHVKQDEHVTITYSIDDEVKTKALF